MKKAFLVILITNILLHVAGCAVKPKLLRKEIIGDWQVERTEIKFAKIQFNNTLVGIVGPHFFDLAGNVSFPYTQSSFEKRTYNYRSIYDDGTYKDWQPIRESRQQTKQKKYIPDVLYISNPYGPDTKLYVDPQGNFIGRIEVSPEYYFTNAPVDKPYYNLYSFTSPTKLVMKITMPESFNEPQGFVNNHSVELPKFYFAKIDVDKVKDYVKTYAENKLCQISMSFKDQITRQNVSPQITITAVDAPSYESCITELRKNLESEFAGDKDLMKLGMASAKKGYFNSALSDVREYVGQSIYFSAMVGAKYRIETVHGAYNYFKDFVSPVSSEPLDKTILLVEKGEKIRVQEVREGEGGTMVDSDL